MRTSDVIAAVVSGDVDALRAIAREQGTACLRGEDTDANTLTPLHRAAASGQEAAVAFLLSAEVGANAGSLRMNNASPLHAAAMKGHARICALLIQSGADPNVQTHPQGYAPLHSAAWGGHLEAVKVLLALGARTDLLNYRAETPAEAARRQRHSAVAHLLEAAESVYTRG